MLTSGDSSSPMKYVIKVRGQVRSSPLPRSLAEAAMANLPVDERTIAELVPITTDGRELLLG